MQSIYVDNEKNQMLIYQTVSVEWQNQEDFFKIQTEKLL